METIADRREAGKKVFREMGPPAATANHAPGATPPPLFAAELGELSMEAVFGLLWTRPGLSRRDRSLVTVAMLIALRAHGELRYHFPIALKNGVTREELEEIIYQATGYAGFPAAGSARAVAREVLAEE